MENKSKTIAGNIVEPNKEINPIQAGKNEDPRMVKIRQYKGTVQDFKSYIKDKENETIQPEESKIDIEKY